MYVKSSLDFSVCNTYSFTILVKTTSAFFQISPLFTNWITINSKQWAKLEERGGRSYFVYILTNFWFWEYLSLICKGRWWVVPDFFFNLNKVIFVWKHWPFFLQFCEIKVPNSKMLMSKFCKIFNEFLMHEAFTILYILGKILII